MHDMDQALHYVPNSHPTLIWPYNSVDHVNSSFSIALVVFF
jgi:hypothetical protein